MDYIFADNPFCLDVFVFLAFNAIFSMILLSQKLLHSKIFTLHKTITVIIMISITTLHIVVIDHKIAKLFQKEEYNHYGMEHNHYVRVDLQKYAY
jgi:hypothetical protein